MKVVLANGCFDILHKGHVLHLQEASKMGDRLVVALTRDKFVNKGPGRPMFELMDRMYVVGALRYVHSVCSCDNVIEALEYVKPDIFVKGPDYLGKIEPVHLDYCKAHGIEIKFTNGEKLSSTAIHDRLRKS